MEDKSLSLKASDTRSTTKHRTVFLLIIPNRLFKAHWSLMVPYTEESPQSTRIRVTGDVLNGFRHEIERAYIVAEDDRHPKIIDLGKVSEGDVVVGWSKTGIDATPTNRFEELALGVRAPGPGMGAASVEGGEVCRNGFLHHLQQEPINH
jgi:hypothetical protein